MGSTKYRVLVDWDNNGNFVGTYDDQPAFHNPGIDIRTGRDTPRRFSPTKPGDAAWVADNRDKRFNSPAGVLGSNLVPNRPVSIVATHTDQVDDFESGWSLGTYDGATKKLGNSSLSVTASGDTRPLKGVSQDWTRIAAGASWYCWVHVSDPSKLSLLRLWWWSTSQVNGYQTPLISGSSLVAGWNLISGTRTALTSIGSPNWASIAAVQVRVQAVTGQTVTVKFDDWGWSNDYTLFTGVLDNWQVHVPQWPLIVADFTAVDRLGPLADSELKISTALYNGLRTDQAITVVLNAVGFPTGKRQLDQGYTQLGYWWLENANPLTALQDIVQHEQGHFYIDASGVFVFENRYNRADRATSTSPRVALNDIADVSSIKWATSVRDVINSVEVTTQIRSPAISTSTIWELGEALILAPNESQSFVITTADPFIGAVQGGNQSKGSASYSFTRTSGQSTILTVTAGPNGLINDNLHVIARLVPIKTDGTYVAEDAASQSAYGIQKLRLDLRHLAEPNTAASAAQYLVRRYANPVESVSLTISAPTNQDIVHNRMFSAMDIGLSDFIQLDLPFVSISWAGFIESLDQRINSSLHEVTYRIERAGVTMDIFLLDSNTNAQLDQTTVLGW